MFAVIMYVRTTVGTSSVTIIGARDVLASRPGKDNRLCKYYSLTIRFKTTYVGDKTVMLVTVGTVNGVDSVVDDG